MRTAVVVPTYNEAENLPVLAARLLALEPSIDVVVVDDDSPDGTGDIADALAAQNPQLRVIHRTGPRGFAAASREGIRWCLSRGYDAVASMDADLSHDPDMLPLLVAAVEDGADLAIGSRYVEGGGLDVDWGPFRRAVSRWGSRYAHLMLGTGVRDCTNGFRCYRSAVLAGVDLDAIQSDGYSFLIEMLGAMDSLGARMTELPITYVDRQAGRSKISRMIILEALWRTTLLGVRRMTGQDRRPQTLAR